jgi:hypothetical protein
LFPSLTFLSHSFDPLYFCVRKGLLVALRTIRLEDEAQRTRAAFAVSRPDFAALEFPQPSIADYPPVEGFRLDLRVRVYYREAA